MKRFIVLFGFLFVFLSTWAQSPAKYWVQFKDKANSVYSVQRPSEFLSDRAILKRQKFNIPITEQDFPVNQSYIDRLLAIDTTMVLFTSSKWLNGVTVYSETEDIIEKINALPFVLACEMTIPMKKVESFDYPIYQQKETPVMSSELPNTPLDYGYSFRQLSINGANYLHQLGAHGEGMLMVVMDAGFHNVPTISHFDKLRNDGRLLGTRNFVQPGRTVFGSESHGTNVLSCIAAYKPGEIIGSAPLASFYLAKTEDSRSENVIEEDNWVAGVEWADSLGCDVLNSSLGYTKFDDSTKVRTYQDLNGKTSRASQAATIAATKGMIICNSAGNEGASEWHYLGSPADSKDIITVGAIDYEGKPAEFSSYGPTADGRIKPDAAAVGFQTVVCNDNGKTDVSYGTSFSSPLLSGMVACLWQLFPNKTNYQIMEVVRFCGSLHERPDSVLGYGITNFLSAHNILSQSESFKDLEVLLTYVRTSKSSVAAYAFSQNTTAYSVSVSLLKSKDIITKNYKIKPGERKKIKIKLPKLPKNESAGMAVIKVNDLTNQTSYIEYIGLTTK